MPILGKIITLNLGKMIPLVGKRVLRVCWIGVRAAEQPGPEL
jgi:hypothetical protein